MKKIEQYVCELCGGKYICEKDAEACEKSHKHINRIANVNYVSLRQDNTGFPVSVTLEMDNGYFVGYRRNGRPYKENKEADHET